MSNLFYTIRNYRPADLDRYLQLNIEVEKLEPTGRCTSLQTLREYLSRPNYSPEQDLFIVEIAENIVSYVDITPELKISRVIFDCLIHPEHRRQGLASKLFTSALLRAKELGVKVAHVNMPESNAVARGMLSRAGFRFVRRYLELRKDISEVSWQDNRQAAVRYRNLRRGDEDELVQIQNRSFTGTWGYNPNTAEEIIYRTNLSGSSPEDVILACDGDRVVGYCWTRTTCKAGTEVKKGQIFMLGVDPDFRGRGVGEEVLLAGLSYLHSKGLQVVKLTVDSENKAACALYHSVGFKDWTSSLWYEKVID
jgi:mycothiol synthase